CARHELTGLRPVLPSASRTLTETSRNATNLFLPSTRSAPNSLGSMKRQTQTNAVAAIFDAAKKLVIKPEHVRALWPRSSGRFAGSTTVHPAVNMDGVVPKRVGRWSPADRMSWTLADEAPAAGPSVVGYTSLSGSQTGIQFVANFSSHCRMGITRNNSVRS